LFNPFLLLPRLSFVFSALFYIVIVNFVVIRVANYF
jgi:hypothetical protein